MQLLQPLPHLHSLSLAHGEAIGSPPPLQLLLLFPALTHLSLNAVNTLQASLYSSLSRYCTRLRRLRLEWATIRTELIHCLAQLPSVQCVTFRSGVVYAQTANVWAALHSLRELRLNRIRDADRLMSVLSAAPSLRVLRWRCEPPWHTPSQQQFSSLPQLESLRSLLAAAPLLHVELLFPRTFDEWRALFHSSHPAFAESTNHRRVWDELHQLPTQLPRVRIVDIDPDKE
jgi:hypothetical protein